MTVVNVVIFFTHFSVNDYLHFIPGQQVTDCGLQKPDAMVLFLYLFVQLNIYYLETDAVQS